jgi:hypothetical protein
VRVPLPPAVLAVTRPDLADLRVVDRAGNEVPFVVDPGVPETELDVRERIEAEPIEVRHDSEELEGGPRIHRETYELPAPPPAEGGWELVLGTPRAAFVRRVELAALRLDGTAEPVVETSAFRFAGSPPRERTRLPLPPAPLASVRVTLTGQDGSFLVPTFVYETRRTLSAAARVAVTLDEAGRTRDRDRTIVRLARPRGFVPDRLRVETTTPAFDRLIEVWDERPGDAPTHVGTARVLRVSGTAFVDERDIDLDPTRGDELRVVVTDGDSPPLSDLTFVAEAGETALVLALDAPDDGEPAGLLLFGGQRVAAPRYDIAALAALPGEAARGEQARALAAVHDRGLPRAHLGEVRANPDFDTSPALAFAMHPGAGLDARRWRQRRSFTVWESPTGLSRVELTAAESAVARADLGDVRVIDGDGRQWPYLLARDDREGWEPVAVQAETSRGRTSRTRLVLPTSPLWVSTLAFDADPEFVDRPFVVYGVDDAQQERPLATGRLVRRSGRAAESITVALPSAHVHGLVLTVDDGDDRPLALHDVRARVLLPALYVAAPPGSYALLTGEPDVAPPRYDIERARDLVLAMESVPVTGGEPEENPEFRLRARLAAGAEESATTRQLLVWVALLIGVAFLTGLTLRLARQPS